MATLEKVSKEIFSDLTKLSGIPRAVTSDLHTLTRVRIFDDGLNSNGTNIGEYTPNTISIKKSKGRFSSSNVNLRDTGKLANSYIFSCNGNSCELGFTNISRNDGKTNSELIDKLQKRYGEIFPLTNKESKEIDNIIEDYLDRIF